VRVTLVGHLTRVLIERELAKAERELSALPPGVAAPLLVDAVGMESYDADARRVFAEWNTANKRRIAKVAVVTTRMLWHMVISTIALTTGQSMRAFNQSPEALAWLNGP
jgi:hypothetical protein